ncbi:bifunctional diaminohydroxyphosphoribosylaminopyrimidine deaminase/5-amino-6-(5-phosphoribosylamino)uracil reductase RibD [Fangia hongkongensis]|uniref:bifunctional diaminohydroxyphosphoribosylaminopyrimidine deaminase/5-amino-6-(5-phosphoribosylamino)uracil reductase RibD n=1 Tax=Fangia hongkongensis TaxID=270495 RepID=UPI0003711195|nr:bifunctional diaminohydroxyphosphoribosylaminopyrimidine deaminase/5-amino-6-(5-phosphoribosylamino)uracil reductase RibD [Fangia hongkongensis]
MFPIDQYYMNQALALARRGKLSVSPNPMVGCVIVKKGKIIAEGWHQCQGEDHAEVMALKKAKAAKENPQGADVYVTLEPCSHIGRTGSCAKALIDAKVRKVIIAVEDPNPKVEGKGIQMLKEAGIEVVLGVAAQQAVALNKIFFYFFAHRVPYVIAKWGMSLDGQLVTSKGDSKQITGSYSQQAVHDLRNRLDAIMIGGNTLKEDDPSLTVRLSSASIIRQPIRVIVSATANLPLNARVFNDNKAQTLLMTTNHADIKTLFALREKSVEITVLPCNKEKEINPKDILRSLAQKGITSVLLEGGAHLLQSFLKADAVNEVKGFIAPKLILGKNKKQTLDDINVHLDCENDVEITANMKKKEIEYV